MNFRFVLVAAIVIYAAYEYRKPGKSDGYKYSCEFHRELLRKESRFEKADRTAEESYQKAVMKSKSN